MINRLFGDYLVKKGYITKEQLTLALDTQKKVRVKLGLIAVAEKLMSAEQAEEVNRLQSVMDKRFGDIAVEKKYLTEEQVERLLSLQGNQYITFAQAVVDNNLMKLDEFEKAFAEYQKSLDFTNTDMEALKSGDTDRIVPLFLPGDCDEYQVEHTLVAVRALIRLVDSDAYVGRGTWVSTVKSNGVAMQNLKGDMDASLAFSDEGDGLLTIAEGFGREKFDEINDDALDAVAEFINCINGMFTTGIASKVSLDMLPPVFSTGSASYSAGRMLCLPVFVAGKQINLLSTFNGVIRL